MSVGCADWPIDVDVETLVGERGGHLFAPFHEDDGVVAGVFKFFVQADGFEFVKKPVDAVFSGGVRVAAEPVGVDVDEGCRGAVGELSVQLAGDGEGG